MRVDIIPIELIIEGERFREDMGNLEELAQSIRDKGLIQPLAVKENADGTFGLLAGGRRLNATKLTDLSSVPVRIYPEDLSELELRSIELEENIRRKDLTWEENVNLSKEIHDLQIAIHGKKISTAPDAKGHSMRDTAELTGQSLADVSRKIKLARAIEEFPDMGWDKCKNQSDADKLLKKVNRTLIRDELVKEAEKSMNGQDIKERLAMSYIVKDFLKALPDLQNGAFDLVEIDPPYAIDLQTQKKNYKYDSYNEIEDEDYPEFMRAVLNGCYQKMKSNSWLILWFAPEPWFETMYQLVIEAGFKCHRMCGIWNKTAGQTNQPDKRLGNAYEMFFYASKGSPVLARSRSNVYDYTGMHHEKKFMPAQRPVEMISDVLTTFAEPNASVLVPFAGSGATLIAAAQNNMLPVGYDTQSQYREEFIIWMNEML